MRAATAALPDPCSATTSTGTSFCDSSRIMASTVRMPALTLSIQIRALPFCGAPAVARISVLSMSILLRFTQTPFGDIWRPKKSNRDVLVQGLTQSRAHSLPNQPRCFARHQDHIYCSFNELLTILLSATYSYVTTLRTNGKFIAHLLGTLRALLPTCLWGQSPHSRKFPLLLPPTRFASPPMDSFCSSC